MKNIQRTIRLSEQHEKLILSLSPSFAKGFEKAIDSLDILLLLRSATIRELYGLFSNTELEYMAEAIKDENVSGKMRFSSDLLVSLSMAGSSDAPDDNLHGVSLAQRIRSLTAGQTEAVFCMLESYPTK